MKTILVYDDVTRFGDKYKRQLENVPAVASKFEVSVIDNEQFGVELITLNRRRKAARSLSGRHARLSKAEMGSSKLDDADVVVVDIDLMESANPFLTGDAVCYLLRCYSRCGVIVGLSQYHKLDFDLGLKGQPDSFADLNVAYNDVASPGLWTDSWDGFRPWQWPNIPLFLGRFESRIKGVEGDLEGRILDVLGIQNISAALPPSGRRFLGKEPSKVTFRDFVLESGNGLRDNDSLMDEQTAARIAAARTTKWIERLILPGQEALVDAPHLVSRYPSLLLGDKSKKDTWNRTAKFLPAEKLDINHKVVEKFRFKDEAWTSRPVWFGIEISNYDKIEEVKAPWKTTPPEYGFCEDASAFFPINKCKKFVADVESSYAQRYIREFEGRVYAPKSNLLG